ncbi:MAG: VacB/RNase II family 3'-5' exoribonuclease [Phycisphaerae bacterium]|nr:VacB/RNase II family 3'-5' exoribonuclease [Phycisphaerae bacterium]
MPLRFRHRLLEHLRHDTYRPSIAREVARQLRVADEDIDAFESAIDQLVHSGKLEVGADEKLRLPIYGDETVGKLRITRGGFGFLIPDEPTREGDLFVPEGMTMDAISGDRVRAKIMRKSATARRGRGSGGYAPPEKGDLTGRVVEILERGQTRFAGVLQKEGRTWLVQPDGRALRESIVVRDPFVKNPQAKVGDKCIVEITLWGDRNALPEGVIVEVLGEAGRPDVETEAVIASHQIRTAFPEEVVEQASAAAREFETSSRGPWKDRLDLTNDFILTIDPPDAKDYDDAISILRTEEGEWELGVHIADVSHFAPAASPLDLEAQARGTSVYLPRRVVPMLPEQLSNGVCSLQEGVARFTKSVFIRFDDKGRVMGQRVAATVIRSAKRLTYIEAQALIDGDLGKAKEHAKTEPEYSSILLDALRLCNRLAKVLRERRRRDGMIALHLPQSELVFDADGHVVDAVPEDSSYTHTLIEMFMVEANEAIARLFADLELPLLRRVHPDPSYGDIEELRIFARLAKVELPDAPTRKDIQLLLERTLDSTATRAIHFAVLRSLAKASYSPSLEGHFALASEHYAHFTSPIRRYPDLLVHRALQAYLDATDNGRDVPTGKHRRKLARGLAEDHRIIDEGVLIDLGNQCTEREIAAEEAERELRSFLILQMLLERHMGDEFEATVTGLAPNGTVFASLEKYLVDGAIPSRDLAGPSGKPDRWMVVASTGRLVAQRSGASIGLGDLIRVAIDRIDLAARQMTLRIVRFAQAAPLSLDESGAPKQGQGGRKDDTYDPNARGGKGSRGRINGHRRGFKQGRRGKKSR